MKIFAPLYPLIKAICPEFTTAAAQSECFSAIDLQSAADWVYWPDSCWLLSRRPLFVPDFANEFIVVPALAMKIGRLGKCIALRFAHRYVGEFTSAFILLPRNEAGNKINPKLHFSDLCFDNAIVLGDWIKSDFESLPTEFDFRLSVINPEGQSSDSLLSARIDDIYQLLSEVSQRNILKMGDVILTPLHRHDHIELVTPFQIREGVSASVKYCNPASDSEQEILHTNFK